MADQDNSYAIPELQNKALKAPGIIPKNAQTWVIVIVAGVMVVVIAFSNSGTPGPKAKSVTNPQSTAAPPNQRQIEQYKSMVDEEARKLATERQKVDRARADVQTAMANAQTGVPGQANPYVNPYGPQYVQPAAAPAVHEQPPEEVQRIALEAERKKREYSSFFSSNVSLTFRKEEVAQTSGSSAPAPPAVSNTPAPTAPVKDVPAKSHKLFEGTVIETVLTNRLNGSFSGPVNAMVTTNVYSHDHQQLLIPQGSRVLGNVEKIANVGQQRLALSFHRLIMPDGVSASLDDFQGLNQIGETGLRDMVNHHYAQIFGVSLAIGAIAGVEQAGTSYGYNSSGVDSYRQGVSQSLSQSALRILDRYLNVLPTFVIREGHRIKVYLTGDLQLPAYEQHKQQPDL